MAGSIGRRGAFAEQRWEQADGSTLVTRAAHIFRRRPEGGVVEPVMTGGMDNPVGLAFTPEGERILPPPSSSIPEEAAAMGWSTRSTAASMGRFIA